MNNKISISTILVLFIFLQLSAQSKNELEIRDFFWGENDEQKSNTEVPEKWKNESAVILYEEHYNEFRRFQKTIKIINAVRKRIVLNDQAAVNEFSEYQFTKNFFPKYGSHTWKKKGEKNVGAKIIKKNGNEVIVEVNNEAIEIDNDAYKLAIPNLEVGDILDIYIHSFQKVGFVGLRSFDPETRLLSQEYPIKEFKLKIDTGNGYFINFNSYNGASKLTQLESTKSTRQLYELVQTDIEKNDFPRWYYPFNELPYYKMKVNYAKSSAIGIYKSNIHDFRPEDAQSIRSDVVANEILEYAKTNDFVHILTTPKWYVKNFEEYIQDRTLNDKEFVFELYNFARHFDYTQFAQLKILLDSNIEFDESYDRDIKVFSDHTPTSLNFYPFAAFLKKQGLAFDYVVLIPRNRGSIEDLLYSDELETVLRVKLPNEVLYLSDIGIFSSAGVISPYNEATNAYLLTFNEKQTAVEKIEKVEMPTTTFVNNIETEKTILKINKGFSLIEVHKEANYFGHTKKYAQDNVLSIFEIIDEDYKYYDRLSYLEKRNFQNRYQESVPREYKALENKSKENRLEYLKKTSEEEYGTAFKTYELAIENTGRYVISEPFTLKEEFTIESGFIKKAGENYLFEIGKFIGGQVAIDKSEKQRKENIYIDYPKTYENLIELEIPEGYMVQGLEKLEKKVENATGGFISSAKIEGNKLIVNTKKFYKNYFEKNDNWPLMVSFLDVAYQFSQENILLKKI